jgi:hypothetical protein
MNIDTGEVFIIKKKNAFKSFYPNMKNSTSVLLEFLLTACYEATRLKEMVILR